MTEFIKEKLPIIPGNAQHIGARNEQQDSFGFSAFDDAPSVVHAGILAVVADGMGGLAMGKDASAAAVKTFLSAYMEKEPEEKIAASLDRSLHAANRAVNRMAKEAGLEGEVGTTIVAVVIHDGLLYRVAAGDSRIYLFRDGLLRQLTTDYNYARVLDRMVEKGEMKRSEAENHPSRAALVSFLGKAEVEEYDHPKDPPLELLPGDKILLATDGLFGFLPEKEFGRLLKADPQKAAENLVTETVALQRPYQDNITVAILGYGAPAAAPLADTRTKIKDADESVLSKRNKKNSAMKWLEVAVLLIVLAALGFIGGQYFGRQSDSIADTPGATDKAIGKPDVNPADKVPEKPPDKPAGEVPAPPQPPPDKQ